MTRQAGLGGDGGGLEVSDLTDQHDIGILPEDVVLVAPGTPSALAGEIYVVEPMGNETLVDLRVGDQRLIVRARRGFSAPIGSSIGAAFDTAEASFFDADGVTVVHRAPGKGGMK